MAPAYLDETIRRLREFEGSVPWMYLDTVGKVTVGVGLMLPTGASAIGLPFMLGDRHATADEIAQEYDRVSGLAKGRLAKTYAKAKGLRLPDEAIETKLRETIEGFEDYLRKHIPRYDALPGAAKMALLDMVYNLGPGKLFAEYRHLLAAIESGDWKAAAAASSRRGPAPARNQWTRQQLLQAAKEKVEEMKAAAESPSSRWVLVAFTAAAAALVALFVYQQAEEQ